jgi:DNA repair photolyase
MERGLATLPRKGRGALSNASGRFEQAMRVPIDDGWGDGWGDGLADGGAEDDGWAPPPLPTTVTPDASRSVIARNTSPDLSFDRSINPYRGCEHGCVYCFARPSHAYLGLSPGLDFESRLFAKPEAPALLEAELRRPGYACAVIAMGTNTDPYQPVERGLRITRGLLQVLAAFSHPVSITTKGALVLRDIDVLAPMARRNLAHVMVSVTTLDRGLSRRLEPRAASPERRLDVIRALSEAGIPVGVMTAPMIPGLNDAELEDLLEAGRQAGASAAGYILVRLPLEIKDLFRQWLEAHAPHKAARVLSLIRGTRDGRLDDPEFGSRQCGTGPYAELLARRFEVACRRLGLDKALPALCVTAFRPPPQPGDQLPLF